MARKWDGRKCPVCGAGTLHDDTRLFSTNYRGEEFAAEQGGAFCDMCGDGIVYDDPTFDKKWDEFRANVDREQAAELAAYRRNLGISQEIASRLSGGGHNAFSRYEGQKAQPVVGVLNLFRILNRLLTHDPALLNEFVPEAKPLYGVFAATRSAAIDLARSMASYSARPRLLPPILEDWPVLKVAKEAVVTIDSPSATRGSMSGITILPNLNVSVGPVYDVDVYPTGNINPWAGGESTLEKLRSHYDRPATEFYAVTVEKDHEDTEDEDVFFAPPLIAQMAKQPRPPVKTIKFEKSRKRVQTG